MQPFRPRCLVALLALLVAAAPAAAHPVPSSSFDRFIKVRITADGVEVDYRLEVNPLTVYLQIAKLLRPAEQAALRGAKEIQFYEAFRRAMEPIVADRLEAWQDDAPLTFRPDPSPTTGPSIQTEHNVVCLFRFKAPWKQPPASGQRFRFLEGNFEDVPGEVDLAFADASSFELTDRQEPSAELKARPAVERTHAEERRLRQLAAVILAPVEAGNQSAPPAESAAPPPPLSFWQDVQKRGLRALLDLPGGLVVVLLASIVFGAAHAVQPGHGKTLVAAYLVGERGTVGHAVALGLITTLTHTGAVLIISVILSLTGGGMQERIHTALSFVSGILVVGLGLWLLLRRLAGQADHFHFFGGKHHHHGPDGHHPHPPAASDGRVRWWNLVLLGVGGGLVPCWDAIVLQVYVTAKGELWLGPPIILAFSAGLAATLVAVGILVVKLKGFGASRWGQGRFIRALPIISALLITLLGVWLVLDSAR